MSLQAYRKQVQREAGKIARELERSWPQIHTRVSLDTQEGEDAYIWITAPTDLEDDIRTEATALTVDLYDTESIYVVPRLLPVSAEGLNSKARHSA